MNVLHVIRSLDPLFGGPAEGIRQFCRSHAAAGGRAEVATLDEPQSPWLQDFPSPVHALGPATGTYGRAPGFPAWLAQNAHRFDAVIVNGLWQYHGYGTRRGLRASEVPYFVYPHGMLDPWFKRAYPLKHCKKWLYWNAIERRVLRDAAAVLFTTEQERLLAQETFPRARWASRVVGYGIAAPEPDAAAQLESFFDAFPHLRGRHLYLHLGRIHPKKGCDLLVRAFAEIQPRDARAHLVMAGPDEMGWTRELTRLAASLGVEQHISWTGMLSGPAKWGALRAAHVFALPSHQENFGVSVAEALACGVPVLISDQVNICREVEAADAGLVAADTLQGTRESLRRWVGLPLAQQEAMRANAVRCFAQHFTIEATMTKLLDVLRGQPRADYRTPAAAR
jgi:glycosyltransferase involved in cell wall biosynthesis